MKQYQRRPNISFWSCNEKSNIRLSISLLSELNYPKYLRVLVNPETKEIAFQSSNKKDIKALKVLYMKHSADTGAIICSKTTIIRIYDICNWELLHSYNCRDFTMIENKIIIFDLKTAKDVTKNKESNEDA